MAKKRIGQTIATKNADELFGEVETESTSSEICSILPTPQNQSDKVHQIDVNRIKGFYNHTFEIIEEEIVLQEDFIELRNSLKTNGQMSPAEVRPCKDDGFDFELIAGHRRHLACKLENIKTLDCIIKNLNDDEATVRMVDSNIHRERIKHRELAKSYKASFEARKNLISKEKKEIKAEIAELKKQGLEIPVQLEQKLGSYEGKSARDIFSDNLGTSSSKIQRYLRLAELIPDLLCLLDSDKNPLAVMVGVELSYLDIKEQEWVFELIDFQEISVSLKQATLLHKHKTEGTLTKQLVKEILLSKTEAPKKIKLNYDDVRSYFPEEYTEKEIIENILKILENTQNKRAI